MKKLRIGLGFLTVLALSVAACDESESDDDVGADQGGDTTQDTGDDTSPDAADVAADVATDPVADAVSDASADQGDDASADSGTDLGGDAAADAMADADAVSTGDADGGPLVEATRFAIEVSNDIEESIWVQLNDGLGQVAWVTVTDEDGGRIWFEERCDIEECEDSTGVCGIAETRIRDITGGSDTGSIEYYWNGEMSVFEGEGIECERRVMAPAGTYEARFCFNGTVVREDEGSGDPTVGVSGYLEDPVCGTVEFDWPTDEAVIYEIVGG